MTEQPVETEQQFLGNDPMEGLAGVVSVQVLPILTDGQQEVLERARQHYVPGAHLLRGPLWSPADNVELSALVRKCTNANKLLAIAKAEAAKAEDALSLALGVENEAAEAVRAAELDLIDFTRKDTGL
ncbi:hypothetical protein [Pseudarthrobacter sp. CCNWLW207]|uniref:hypothetical protein n=1 Tax=Pseudarthrobacter sp. CCNWLW207 TaxID=3127468 RepID=UPI003076DADD